MADVRHEEMIAGAVRGGERGGDVAERRQVFAVLRHRLVDHRVKPPGPYEDLCGDRRIDPQVPPAVVEQEVSDGAEGHATRDRSRPPPPIPSTTAIRKACSSNRRGRSASREAGRERFLPTAKLYYEVVVFVRGPEHALMGSRRELDPDRGRRGKRLVDRQRRCQRSPSIGVVRVIDPCARHQHRSPSGWGSRRTVFRTARNSTTLP